MAIDFPSSPTTGQVFIVGSVTYIWDGTKWTSSATNSPFSLGSASTPSITFIGDTNTGLYSPGADQVSIATSGSEQIRIGSNGEIGIGGATYGTNGQVLTSSGSGSAPSWSTLPTSLVPADIGVTVQGYDATTLKSADIGVTVQGYDVDTAKLDAAQTWSAAQTFGADLTLNSQYDLRFADADSSNWVAFQAPATVASNVTWTLPNADGTTGQVLSTNGAGVLAFATIAAGSSLNVASKTSAYTAVEADSGYMLLCSGSWTLSLTAAATLGDGWYLFVKNIGTGTITIDPNASELIGGVSTAALNPGDLWLFSCTGTAFELNRLEGFNYQDFSSSGTFTVPSGVRRLFVQAWGAGGGGGRTNNNYLIGSGGGGGGYGAGYVNVTPGDSCTITVGTGGSGASSTNSSGTSGGQSSFVHSSKTISGNGGSGGGYTNPSSAGASGGSGSGDWSLSGSFGLGFLDTQSNSMSSFGGFGASGSRGGLALTNGGSLVFYNFAYPSSPGGGGAGGGALGNAQSGSNGLVRIQWV